MTNRDCWKQAEANLAGLRTYDADPTRVERIRARCLESLAAQRRTARNRRTRLANWRRWLEPAIAFGLSALYLINAFGGSLRLLR